MIAMSSNFFACTALTKPACEKSVAQQHRAQLHQWIPPARVKSMAMISIDDPEHQAATYH
jgi:hypothetical protein